MGTRVGDEFSRQDIEFHRDRAATYDETVTREFDVYHRYSLDPFLDRVAREAPGGRALDLGCGTGVVSLELARRGFDVVGIDHSAEMLALARSKLEAEGFPDRATFEEGDVRRLRFDASSFSCVTCQGLLHHLEEIEPCLREIERVLVSRGFFYISEPCRDPTPLKRALLALWRVGRRRRRPAAGHEGGPETVEMPISASQLRAALDELGLMYRLEFLTHLPPLRRRLAPARYLQATRILSWPWRRRKGDLVFVYGRKPPAPATTESKP